MIEEMSKYKDVYLQGYPIMSETEKNLEAYFWSYDTERLNQDLEYRMLHYFYFGYSFMKKSVELSILNV
ncbi:MAG: hypothetical protein C0174_01805 [Thermodesulfobium narugense]|nr:MAG: hypothetical protein C0174_01805 [Thermodesulfobium narugense]